MSGKHDQEQQRRVAHAAKKENILGKTEQATEQMPQKSRVSVDNH